MMEKTLVCIDRDGTLIYDDKYYLGSQENWRELVKIMPGVVAGIRKLRKNNGIVIYMITNQSGVAIKEFPLLTERRMHEVCRHAMKALEEKGAGLDGYYACPHVSPEYKKAHPEYTYEEKMVCTCSCIKPYTGMVVSSASAAGIDLKAAGVYVIGDRESDVNVGIRAGGKGILVPFKNEAGEEENVKKNCGKGKYYIAKSFSDACSYVLEELC